MAEAGKLVLIGAGGHAKVAIELLRQAHPHLQLVGALDPAAAAPAVLGVPVLGGDDLAATLRAEGVTLAFVALGDNLARERAGERLRTLGFSLVTAVSPQAAVSPSARLGAGIAVLAGAVINAEATVADLAIVNSGAVVEHDAQLGLAAHAAPNSALAGGARLGARSLLGVGAAVLPGVSIGDDTQVGGGACVTYDLPDGVIAVGAPARIVKSRYAKELP